MPCCIAILKHLQCQHSVLFKIGCTSGCEEHYICPPEKQETLILAKHRWACEDCLSHRFGVAGNERGEWWDAKAREIDLDATLDKEAKILKIMALRTREDFEDDVLEKRRLAQVEEIQWAEEWVFEYGMALFKLLHHVEPTATEHGNDGGTWPLPSHYSQGGQEDINVERDGQKRDLSQCEEQLSGIYSSQSLKSKRDRLAKLLLVKQADLIIIRDASRESIIKSTRASKRASWVHRETKRPENPTANKGLIQRSPKDDVLASQVHNHIIDKQGKSPQA